MNNLGPLTSLLGMEIQGHRPTRIVHLSQQPYIDIILERHGISDCSQISTPVDPHVRLHKSPPEHLADSVYQQWYQSAMGSLLFTMIGTRLDITFATSAVIQYNNNPPASDGTAVCWISRYLNNTSCLGLNYGTGECGGYINADWGAGEDRQSIGGYPFCINRGTLSSTFKKQPSVTYHPRNQNTWHLHWGSKRFYGYKDCWET